MSAKQPTLDDFKRQIAQLANRHHNTANRCFPAGFGIQAHQDRGALIALAVELLGRLRVKTKEHADLMEAYQANLSSYLALEAKAKKKVGP